MYNINDNISIYRFIFNLNWIRGKLIRDKIIFKFFEFEFEFEIF